MNDSLAVTLIVLLLIIPIVVGAMVLYGRKNLREAKNYERGLKMVPLLIHLPPSSDDLDKKGRDIRDIADESIFKAQTLYNILSSTTKKGFKSSLYGQRHISLEIVASKGRVYFYTAAPISMVPVIEQAVLSAYPNSRLEEVAEHNIFSPIGKSSGTIGGELVLKESFTYPISTYQDIKRDTMQALLNALSNLEKEDGAGIQILIRPAPSGWAKTANTEAQRLREGKKKQQGMELVFWWIKQIFVAPFKPPEGNDEDKLKEAKSVSGSDQSKAEAMEEKARHGGYEVLIRVVASSNISHRSQVILNNIISVFSLFDAPGKNGFKFVTAKDIDSFVLAYVLRFFPPEQKRNILNDVELATIFHLPDSSNVPTTQLERQQSKQVDGPRNILDEGLLLGYNVFRGAKKPIRLSTNDRRRHMYVVGQTGTGKSVFLENMALQDMLEGRGFAFVDPHGDAAESLLGMVPKERTEDVIYFCPADMDYPMGLNLFEYHTPEQKDFLIQEVIAMLYKLYDPQHQGIIGPRYEHIFRNCALLLMADPEGGTFIDVPKLLTDYDYAKQKLKHTNDRMVLDFWTKEFPNSQRSNESGEVTSWVVSKFGAFMSNEMMRNIIGQNKSSFDMREIMDEGKILLVNLSKGRSGELNSKLLGMIFVMKFQAAAMSRADTPEDMRRDFSLYVDEFQNFSTDSFAEIMSEARKYRLNLIVANQFTTQLSEEIRDAVFGNMGTVISHRVGNQDAEVLEKYYRPIFDVDDLQQLPNYKTIVKMLIGGVPTQPFSMDNLPPLGHTNKKLADALKQLSAVKYGHPKSKVEKEIFDRLTTKEVPKPAFGASPFGGASGGLGMGGGSGIPPFGQAPAGRPAIPASGSGSFLDDWLAKRRAQEATKPNAVNSLKDTKPLVSAPSNKSESTIKQTTGNNLEEKAVKKSTPEANIVKNSKDELPNKLTTDNTDNQEIDSIAQKLKESLKEKNASNIKAKDVPSVASNQISKQIPQKDETKANGPVKATSGDGGFLNHDDTIHIDQDGNITSIDDKH
jgi:hypothetical protein